MSIKEAIIRILENEKVLAEKCVMSEWEVKEFQNHVQNIEDMIRIEGLQVSR